MLHKSTSTYMLKINVQNSIFFVTVHIKPIEKLLPQSLPVIKQEVLKTSLDITSSNIGPPVTSTITSLTGGHIIVSQQQQIQHQQQQQHSHNKKQMTNSDHHQTQSQQLQLHQPQHHVQQSTQQQNQQPQLIQNHIQVSNYEAIQSRSADMPITIIRTGNQENTNNNSTIQIHHLTASAEQHSVVY